MNGSVHLRNAKKKKQKQKNKKCTHPEGSQDDSGDLLFDGLLEDVGQRRHHVVASQLLAELRTEGQQPNTEDHLVLELEAAFVAQHRCDATAEKEGAEGSKELAFNK